MSFIMVDIEADGPIPGDYSMICFGAVVVEPSLSKTFYGRLAPISERWVPVALTVSGRDGMVLRAHWITAGERFLAAGIPGQGRPYETRGCPSGNTKN